MDDLETDTGREQASDPTLVSVATSDDFETVFRAHYGRLVQALTVVCGSPEEAADCVQDAFVRAHLRWSRISRYDDPVGWIRRVAINRVRDERRGRSRRDRLAQRLASHRLEEDSAPQRGAMTDLLAALPRQQRVAMALFYVEGASVAQVAEAMELSVGAVKFHLNQGRTRLRELQAREG